MMKQKVVCRVSSREERGSAISYLFKQNLPWFSLPRYVLGWGKVLLRPHEPCDSSRKKWKKEAGVRQPPWFRGWSPGFQKACLAAHPQQTSSWGRNWKGLRERRCGWRSQTFYRLLKCINLGKNIHYVILKGTKLHTEENKRFENHW